MLSFGKALRLPEFMLNSARNSIGSAYSNLSRSSNGYSDKEDNNGPVDPKNGDSDFDDSIEESKIEREDRIKMQTI